MAPVTATEQLSDARRILRLVLTTQRWIWRRADRLAFVDARTVRRTITWDIELAPSLAEGCNDLVIPLGMLRDGVVLQDLKIVDETGEGLVMLNRRDNKALTAAVIQRLFGGAAIKQDVRTLVTDGNEQARSEAKENLLKQWGDRPRKEIAHSLLGDLVENYLVLIALPPGRGLWRSISFSFEEAIELFDRSARDTRGLARCRALAGELATRMAWRDQRVTWQQASIGDASSFHVDVEVPRDLELTAAQLDVAAEGGPYRFPTDALGPRARLYTRIAKAAPLTFWPRGTAGEIHLKMRPRAADLLAAGSVLSLITGAMLVTGSFRMEELLRASDGAAPLLIALAPIAAAYLARPSEHALTAKLTALPRVVIAVPGLLAFACAFMMLLPERRDQAAAPPAWLENVWWGAGLASLVAALALCFSWWRTTRSIKPTTFDECNRDETPAEEWVGGLSIRTIEGRRELLAMTPEELDHALDELESVGAATSAARPDAGGKNS